MQGNVTTNSPLTFQILKTSHKARASVMTLPHGAVQTPVYMPVGTKGTIKGLTSLEMEHLNCKILLGNTYHLAFQPGAEFLKECNGLHSFMNWPYNILTDSGGFQMVSLSKLCEINEQQVQFQSPVDGSLMVLKPEDSIYTQNCIGGDIMMQLDDVVKPSSSIERIKEANRRSVRWLDRCIEAHGRKKEQNLFGIIQGGTDVEERKMCLEEMIKRDLPGYAIGGLAGDEMKSDFWKIVNLCTDMLPKDKPRYLMGVGYPVDLVVCSCLGVDMFDCVFSTRTARFGTAFTKNGFLRIKGTSFLEDFSALDENCGCSVLNLIQTCQNYTKSYISQLVTKQEVACHLMSTHNLFFLLTLMKNLRQAIIDGNIEQFVNKFMYEWFKNDKKIPDWIYDAMDAAKIKLDIKF